MNFLENNTEISSAFQAQYKKIYPISEVEASNEEKDDNASKHDATEDKKSINEDMKSEEEEVKGAVWLYISN